MASHQLPQQIIIQQKKFSASEYYYGQLARLEQGRRKVLLKAVRLTLTYRAIEAIVSIAADDTAEDQSTTLVRSSQK